MIATPKHQQAGFTMIEVILTLSLLVALTVTVSSMLRSAVDVREGLAINGRVNHRLSFAMQKIANDIEHAFIVSKNDQGRQGATRLYKTIFKIERSSDSDKLFLTTMGGKPLVANNREFDMDYVVYEVKDAEDSPGRRHLYRGSVPLTLEDLRDDPPMEVIARNIKSLRVMAWRGDDWAKDRWDSSRSEWVNKIPHMVRVDIESWADDPSPGQPVDPLAAENVVALHAAIPVIFSLGVPEIRQPTGSLRWY